MIQPLNLGFGSPQLISERGEAWRPDRIPNWWAPGKVAALTGMRPESWRCTGLREFGRAACVWDQAAAARSSTRSAGQ